MNVFDKLRYEDDREVVDRLFHSPALKVERIASKGQSTSFMVQEEDELVFLVRGEAIDSERAADQPRPCHSSGRVPE